MIDNNRRSPQPNGIQIMRDREGTPGSGQPPNVVMIVLDDLGFADFGCYGSRTATPHIDAVANNGLRYSNFHVTAECSPSRACLLTGRNHHRVGMGTLADRSFGYPGYTCRIPKSAGTVARCLQGAGYNTFAVGKWHLGPGYERTPAGPFDHWPLGMGFDRYYGFLPATTDQWSPDLVRDNTLLEPPSSRDESYHLTEDLVSQAIRFIQDQQQAAPGKPFFCYFAPAAMHAPHQAPRASIESFYRLFDDGWDNYRNEIFQRQIDSGLIPADTTLTARPSCVAAWGDLTSQARRVHARQMETYAGFLAHTDAQIGRLLEFLKVIGAIDNTIIMILSDNGAEAAGGPDGRLGPSADDIASMLESIDDFGGVRSKGVYSWGWAVASNTPFRLWKRYSWLGGTRVPLVLQWPSGITPDNRGAVRPQFCHAIDIMPTILEAVGFPVPSTIDGVEQSPLDGRSIVPTFNNGDRASPRIIQYFETRGSRSIYHDGWKATTDYIDRGNDVERKELEGSHEHGTDRWSLFNVRNDFSESRDLAETYPRILQKMIDLWHLEAARNNVLPLIDRRVHLPEKPPYFNRREFIGLPGAGPLVTPSAFRGFRMIADFRSVKAGTNGVICAHRNQAFGFTGPGGWACYARSGELYIVFVLNDEVTEVEVGRLSGDIRHKLQISYTPDSAANGTIEIELDQDRKYSAELVQAAVVSGQYPEAKLLVGRDHGFPLCDSYDPPFPFSGHISRVVLHCVVPSEPAVTKTSGEPLEHD